MAVPFALAGALLAVLLRGMPNDIYFQIGLITLIGLAAKNAILIVEFAEQKMEEGMPVAQAALEAAIKAVRGGDSVDNQEAEGQREALKKYTLDLTERARMGKLDPVIGRFWLWCLGGGGVLLLGHSGLWLRHHRGRHDAAQWHPAHGHGHLGRVCRAYLRRGQAAPGVLGTKTRG